MQRITVVTGANRGIGFEICRQLGQLGDRVVLGARDPAKGEAAAARLRHEGLEVEAAVLDVADASSVRAFADDLLRRHGRVDRLVNNAGVMLDHGAEASALTVPDDVMRRTMEVNVYGALRMAQALVPGMRTQGFGRIVNLSSGLGQLADMNGHWAAYRTSKTALNALTRILADELQGSGILVNAVCPGWVKTDMGGASATRTVERGAETPVWLATLPDDGLTGGFFRDRLAIAW